MIKRIPNIKLALGIIILLILLAPLAIAIYKTPGLGLTLLGVPAHIPDFGANLASLGAQYLGFNKPGGTTLMTPFFELGSMLIILIGAYNVIKNHFTAKSHIIIIWILCLIPVIIFNPSFTNIVFLPLVLLLASGLSLLLSSWYNLFPHNPYARIGGLIPIVILVTVLVFSGMERYVYGYRYDPDIAPNFSQDISLIPKDTQNIVTSDNELAFYNIVAKHNKDLTVSTTIPNSNDFIATRAAKQTFAGYKVQQIITTSLSNESDRLYLYKKITE
jgi:hypothetical protein